MVYIYSHFTSNEYLLGNYVVGVIAQLIINITHQYIY